MALLIGIAVTVSRFLDESPENVAWAIGYVLWGAMTYVIAAEVLHLAGVAWRRMRGTA